MSHNNTNYSDYYNEDITIGYVILFFAAAFIITPRIYHYIKKICDDDYVDDEYVDDEIETEEEYDENNDIEIAPDQRELKPDYSSNDDDDDKYI